MFFKPRLIASAAATLAGLVGPAAAQDGYLFRAPQVTLTVRLGAAAPAADSEIYDFFTRELTIERNDFRTAAWGGDLAATVTPRLDLLLSASSSKASIHSEFREWVDQDDRPIEQVTRLRRTPLALSAKYHLRSRGTKLGEYAWVPNRLQPYAGAGAGVMFYHLEQSGDFVDFETRDVFSDQFEAKGSAPLLQVLAGAEWWLAPRVGLAAEGRYAWSSAKLKTADFRDWESIDLRGFQLTTGLALRF